MAELVLIARTSFVVPTIYYMSRYRLPRPLPTKLLVLGLGIGLQGVLGWYMVKSGLDEQIVTDKAVPRVSQYRLAAHLTAALALYIGMVQTAIGIRGDLRAANALKSGSAASRLASERFREILANGAVKRFKITSHIALSMVLLTAISGAFVAGLDAGLVYNEFPTMGGRLMPPADELLDKRYAKRADQTDVWWRNIFENPVTAQFDHRLFVSLLPCLYCGQGL
jgi:cytochrome c oxidase assembly protein subunit 15